MARFIPHINPEDIENRSERLVAEALSEQLPETVTVFHSIDWIRKAKLKPLQEGECDFTVLDPNNGLLFIEVKGGLIRYNKSIGKWIRLSHKGSESELNKDPVAQVRRNMHNMVENLKAKLGVHMNNICYACAVVFPDGKFTGDPPPGTSRAQIFDVLDLNEIGKGLLKVLKLFKRKSSRCLNESDMRRIESALYPTYNIVPVLWKTVAESEKRLHRLTDEQKSILDILEHHKIATIQGGTGTGKTLLAITKAQEIASSGLKTLLLCYNRPLCDWLNLTVDQDCSGELTIMTYHGFVRKMCGAADILFQPYGDHKFWHETAPDLLSKAFYKLPSFYKFDAIVVDEGQDFLELWWHSLEDVFVDSENKAFFYVFYDPHQNLNIEIDINIPSEFGKPYTLNRNCRNSAEIAELCHSLLKMEQVVDSGMRNGIDPIFHEVDSHESGFQKIEEIIGNLYASNNGLKKSQIAVLLPGSLYKKHWPNTIGTIPVADDIHEWQSNSSVLMTTYRRAKGLEADAVVVLVNRSTRKLVKDTMSAEELEAKIAEAAEARLKSNGGYRFTANLTYPNQQRMRECILRYVAFSRAKHILEIVEVISDK